MGSIRYHSIENKILHISDWFLTFRSSLFSFNDSLSAKNAITEIKVFFSFPSILNFFTNSGKSGLRHALEDILGYRNARSVFPATCLLMVKNGPGVTEYKNYPDYKIVVFRS